MRDRPRSGPPAEHSSPVERRALPARLVSSPRRSAAAQGVEARLRCALRCSLFDAFERGKGWHAAWSGAWPLALECIPQLRLAAPDMSTKEEDYRSLLALDWRRWRSG